MATIQIPEKLPNKLGFWLRKSLVPTAISVWIAVTVFAFWKYEIRYLLPVARPAGAAKIDASTLPLVKLTSLNTTAGPISLVNPGHPVLINFWNPQCPCSTFMEHHVHELLNHYSKLGVRFVTVVVSPEDGLTKAECAQKWLSRGFSSDQMPYLIDSDNSISRKLGVWAAPAAVIVDSKGQVAYIGAYNVSRFCDSDDTAFAQKALEDILAGRNPKIRTLPFYGCQITAESVKSKI